ncbi:AraC family transcriptional regulator [Paenibacillus spongiae]|uniref:AraC family transcriptional regulator n=1 Tax=Paenibacillus spongiae TaxID=2909671 RepID=A0ABY5SBS9_9BACL|nr:AraC family transcriptional regulator [Paenibacillus spongiae]UVI31416.1 AraC family transcriptional regulator [Paenibacillus spongiae]
MVELSAGRIHPSFIAPFIYHSGKEYRSEAWYFPPEKYKLGNITHTEYGENRKLYRSLPYDYLVYVTTGSVIFDIDGQAIPADKDTIIHIPANKLHRIESGQLPMGYTWVHYRLLMPSLDLGASNNQDYSQLKSSALTLEERLLDLPTVMKPGNHQLIHRLINAVIEELLMEKEGWEMASRAYFQAVLIEVYRNRIVSGPGSESEFGDVNVNKAVEYIHRFFSTKITVEQLARMTNLNFNYFISRFKAATGQTPIEYITNVRINQAKKLIRMEDFTFTEIATLVGFENLSYFSRVFKKIAGVSPKEYKMLHI